MSKEKSFSPAQPETKPDAPAMPIGPKPVFGQDHMAAVFNLWNLRYSENPDEFTSSLDADGKPVKDYGECCAIHFQRLSDEIW